MSWTLINFNTNTNFDGSKFTSWTGHYWWLVYPDTSEDDRGGNLCKEDTGGFCRWCLMDYILNRLAKKIQIRFRKNRRYRTYNYRRNREIGIK